ncbi:MAG: N4-gp56 family major capsid protein [Opitutaceae bacterium]
MADTEFSSSVHSNLVERVWAAKAFTWALSNRFFDKRFVSKDGSNVLQTKTELLKAAGDQVTFRLRAPLTSVGQIDDGELTDNEEALTFHDFSVTLHQRAHAVRSKGKLSERRTQINFRNEAREGLGDWMAQEMDTDALLALSGLPNPAATITRNAPSTNRIWRGGQQVGGTLEAVTTMALIDSATNNLFGTLVISAVKRKAQMGSSSLPRIRPIKIKGKEYYVMFIHPYQAKALKAETAWIAAQQAANVRGESNPLFSGSLGVWDGVIIHEYEKIETRLGAGGTGATEWFDVSTDACANGIYVARALFCGAQAGVTAWGQYPTWLEEMKDYKRKQGIGTDFIYQQAKTEFNSEDFAVITVNTAIVPD